MPIADVMSVRIVSVDPEETVSGAIARMVAESVGAVAVCDGPRLVGIFTERDVLRLAGEEASFTDLRVRDVMTSALVTASPDDDIFAVARLMSERKIRHVPVLQGENLLGVIGIRDILGTLVETFLRTQDPEARETVRELLGRR